VSVEPRKRLHDPRLATAARTPVTRL
jgi:hypothetical protein